MAGKRREEETSRTGKEAVRQTYHVSEVLRLRDRLVEVVAGEYEDRVVRGDEFRRLVQIIYEGLPGEVGWEALEDSVRGLAGQTLTRERIAETCWRLAGNHQRLRQHRPVPPWKVQKFREWVPLQILSCRRGQNARGKRGAFFLFRVMAGTPCPQTVFRWWSVAQCKFFSTDMGFTKPWGESRYPYSAPEQMVSLRLNGLVDPDLCGAEPMFKQVEFPDSLRDWNRELLKYRFRVDKGYDCPAGFSREFPCHHCPVGYKGKLLCVAATHRRDWTRKECKGCGHDDAFFDPDTPGDLCVDCVVKNSYKRTS
jgi:hypothetical protein